MWVKLLLLSYLVVAEETNNVDYFPHENITNTIIDQVKGLIGQDPEALLPSFVSFVNSSDLDAILGPTFNYSAAMTSRRLLHTIVRKSLASKIVRKDQDLLVDIKYLAEKLLKLNATNLLLSSSSSGELPRLPQIPAEPPSSVGVNMKKLIQDGVLRNFIAVRDFITEQYKPSLHMLDFKQEDFRTTNSFMKSLLQHLLTVDSVPEPVKDDIRIILRYVE